MFLVGSVLMTVIVIVIVAHMIMVMKHRGRVHGQVYLCTQALYGALSHKVILYIYCNFSAGSAQSIYSRLFFCLLGILMHIL